MNSGTIIYYYIYFSIIFLHTSTNSSTFIRAQKHNLLINWNHLHVDWAKGRIRITKQNDPFSWIGIWMRETQGQKRNRISSVSVKQYNRPRRDILIRISYDISDRVDGTWNQCDECLCTWMLTFITRVIFFKFYSNLDLSKLNNW